MWYTEMVEVGYCSDTDHDVKIKEKEKQHAQLLAILTEAGHAVRYHPITDPWEPQAPSARKP